MGFMIRNRFCEIQLYRFFNCYVITLRNKTARSNMAELIRHFIKNIFIEIHSMTSLWRHQKEFPKRLWAEKWPCFKSKLLLIGQYAVTYRWLIWLIFLLRHGMALGYTFYTRWNKTVRPQILLRHHFSGKRNIYYVIIMTHSENHNLIVLKKF